VQLEFNASEEFETHALEERAVIVLASYGCASIMLNDKAVNIIAPCALLLSYKDSIKLLESDRFIARSFHFNPTFINSNLSFENLAKNEFTELEDKHDREMMNLFLIRNDNYDGILDLPAGTYLRIFEWLSIIGTELYAQSDGRWTCRIRRYLLQTLYLLDDIFMSKKVNGNVKSKKAPVDIAMEYIHVNYPQSIKLGTLCDFVYTNRTTLNRNFKAKTGKTAMEYLAHYRIKIACEALAQTNITLYEIAEAVGFKYDTYFIKQFSKRMSMTPTEYRYKMWDKSGRYQFVSREDPNVSVNVKGENNAN